MPSLWAVSIPGCIFQWAAVGFWGWVEPFGLFYFQESLKKKLHTLEKNVVQRWAAGILTGLAGSHLIARCAPGLEALGVVPATVDLAVLVEVDQVDQQLVADAADEAGRVPANAVPSSRGEDGHVPAVDLPTTLLRKPRYDMGLRSLLLPVPNELLFQKWQQNVLIHCSGKEPPFWCLSIPFHPQDPSSSPPHEARSFGISQRDCSGPPKPWGAHGTHLADPSFGYWKPILLASLRQPLPTCSQMAPVMVTGNGRTLPLPKFSLFL